MTRPLNVSRIRKDFPILSRKVGKKPLVYLDNAATTQKPLSVLHAMDAYYRSSNANVHRGIHRLAEEATLAYEHAHTNVGDFIRASSMEEVVFTRGTTDSLNMLARMLAPSVRKGDTILVTQMEHHSNLIPWQQLAKAKKAHLRFIPVGVRSGLLDLSTLDRLITPRTKVVALPHVSNVLGTINPLSEIVSRAHAAGAVVVLDAAQSVPHLPVDVKKSKVDFAAFSGHKMYGPTGVGVLYGRSSSLSELEPVVFGGEMVREVSYRDASWNDLPWKFEAGTPPIAEGIGLSAAVDYLRKLGMDSIRAHEKSILSYAYKRLSSMRGVSLYGPSSVANRSGVLAFNVKGIHPHDVAAWLNEDGVAVRAGHHCAMPLSHLLQIPSSSRLSVGVYNTKGEMDILADSLVRAQHVFGGSIHE